MGGPSLCKSLPFSKPSARAGTVKLEQALLLSLILKYDCVSVLPVS